MVNHDTSKTQGIVVLSAGGVFAEVLIDALVIRFGHVVVLEEERESVRAIFRRWVKLRGWSRATGQLAFGPIQRFMAFRARHRRSEILASASLNPTRYVSVPRRPIGNVNSEICRRALRELDPKVVFVVGTRLRGPTLACIDAPFINYHAGINPQYRGQYGGYWAYSNDDDANAGVTVHLIDEGVDTGGVLYTAPIKRTVRDNVATYHYLQIVAAIPIVLRAVEDAVTGKLAPQKLDQPSWQWFHPTAWEYLANGFRRGVW